MTDLQRIRFQRSIPLRDRVDVFVAGGGPSGIAAAVTAARQGRTVYLVEAQACAGGQGTAGLVPLFMQFSDGLNFLAGGIGAEILDKLRQHGGTGPDDKPGKEAWSVPIRVEPLKRLYDELLLEANVSFTFATTLIAVEASQASVSRVILAAKSGIFAVEAKVYIDCTGDGDLAAWAGAPFEQGDENGGMQAGTLCSIWADIDWQAVESSGLGQGNSRIQQAFKDNVFTQQDPHLPGMLRVGRNLGGGNLGHLYDLDGTDERSLTHALIAGRKQMLEYKNYYRRYLRGFENMELVVTGSLLGIRETRRITGDYVLCLDDFKRQADFADEIGRYAYPIDVHASQPQDQHVAKLFETMRYKRGQSYGIPYRILTPKGLDNVFVAGRCVSTDRYMHGSIRVMPACFITGQAAGMAAAVAIEQDTGVRGCDIKEVQQRLKDIGAFLPNC